MATINFNLSTFTTANKGEMIRDMRGSFIHAILAAANEETEDEVVIRFVADCKVNAKIEGVFCQVLSEMPVNKLRNITDNYVDVYKFRWLFSNNDGIWNDNIWSLNNYIVGMNPKGWMQIKIKSIKYVGREYLDLGLRA